ncbi:hypothetical protein DF121_30865 [Burkholderia stagnalis]|nr:hypothetical protein DF145_32665 [Burkholderia stagnalis]RQX89641.1 hypothetical protein DF121_30865 [Burkholderia stagnalis]
MKRAGTATERPAAGLRRSNLEQQGRQQHEGHTPPGRRDAGRIRARYGLRGAGRLCQEFRLQLQPLVIQLEFRLQPFIGQFEFELQPFFVQLEFQFQLQSFLLRLEFWFQLRPFLLWLECRLGLQPLFLRLKSERQPLVRLVELQERVR